jgi:hypothetical protein
MVGGGRGIFVNGTARQRHQKQKQEKKMASWTMKEGKLGRANNRQDARQKRDDEA